MSKKIQLNIPEPCHEGWDNMTPSQKGRFCDSCQKQVVDFSNMSDREIALFFKKPSTGSVCGRFITDQLDRDIDIPKKRIPWFKYFFHFILPTFLISVKSSAQTKKQQEVQYDTSFSRPLDSPILGEITMIIHRTVNGKVTDEQGNPLAFATVRVKGTNVATTSDAKGLFKIKLEKNQNVLQFSYIGFEVKEIDVSKLSAANVVLAKMNTHLEGVVVIKKYEKPKPKKSEIKKEVKQYHLFPNPASPGSVVNIQLKEKAKGDYKLEIFNTAGQSVFQQEVSFDKGSWLLSFDLPSLIAGIYVVKMNEKKSGKSYTEQLIIQ